MGEQPLTGIIDAVLIVASLLPFAIAVYIALQMRRIADNSDRSVKLMELLLAAQKNAGNEQPGRPEPHV